MNTQDKEYLMERLNQYLEPMCIDFLGARPSDPLDWMVNWLKTKGCRSLSDRSDHQEGVREGRYEQTKRQICRLTSPQKKDASKLVREDEDGSDAIKTDESDDEEEMTPRTQAKLGSKTKKLGVSAEVYGKHNPKKEFIPRVIEKTDEQRKKLEKKMSTNFLFSALDTKNKQILIDAMEEKRYTRGEEVIRQGDQIDQA